MCLTVFNGDFPYHIDSVWTSNRKAVKRQNKLNSDKSKNWREEQWISK